MLLWQVSPQSPDEGPRQVRTQRILFTTLGWNMLEKILAVRQIVGRDRKLRYCVIIK